MGRTLQAEEAEVQEARGRGEARQVTRGPFKKDFECLQQKLGFGSAVNLDYHVGE